MAHDPSITQQTETLDALEASLLPARNVDRPRERLLHVTPHAIQRSHGPTPPVFGGDYHLGVLAVTDQRVLFLSDGGSRHALSLGEHMLGLVPDNLARAFQAALKKAGSVAIPRHALIGLKARRRWDLQRYVSIEWLTDEGAESQINLVPVRGRTRWIDGLVSTLGRRTHRDDTPPVAGDPPR